jgi:hypothetical protein
MASRPFCGQRRPPTRGQLRKPPTFATAPKADPSPCPIDSCTLTALATVADDTDGSAAGKLTYTWRCLFETRPVKFSANGTNAAKRTTVTFPAPGMYQFECEVACGAAPDVQKTTARWSVVVRPYEIEIVNGVSFGQPDTIVRCYDEYGSLYAMSEQPGNRPHLVKAVVNLWNDRQRLCEECDRLREERDKLLAHVPQARRKKQTDQDGDISQNTQ